LREVIATLIGKKPDRACVGSLALNHKITIVVCVSKCSQAHILTEKAWLV
jgi:hypothetical protein